ncbi:MAG TPA: hypothetical protein VMK12_29485, partial [Anaeromyxobacteraceae bacterium]|nr:hypothetical protein [Anaeromyxobacteraceae bacterium]
MAKPPASTAWREARSQAVATRDREDRWSKRILMAKPYNPKDFYYQRAKAQGLPARSAYKIE